MDSKNENRPFLTVENFMASVPDAATREELYDVLGDDPMFAPEMLAKARETLDRLARADPADGLVTAVEGQTAVVKPTGIEGKTKGSHKLYLGVSIAAALLLAVIVWRSIPRSQTQKELVTLIWDVKTSVVRNNQPETRIARKGNLVTVTSHAQFKIAVKSSRPGELTLVSLAEDGRVAVEPRSLSKPLGPFLAPEKRRVFFVVVSDRSFPSLKLTLSDKSSSDEIRRRIETFLEEADISWYGLEEIIVATGNPQ